MPKGRLRSSRVLMGRMGQDYYLFGRFDLVERGKNPGRRRSLVQQPETDQDPAMDAPGKIGRVKITARLMHLLRVFAVHVIVPLRVTPAAAGFRAEHVG